MTIIAILFSLTFLQLYPQLNFTKWAKNQPNNGGGWEQDCVEMGGWTTLDEGKWNDADCSSPARFFCEKSQKDPSRGKAVILPAGELVVDYLLK